LHKPMNIKRLFFLRILHYLIPQLILRRQTHLTRRLSIRFENNILQVVLTLTYRDSVL
jgi:hypothetical protein